MGGGWEGGVRRVDWLGSKNHLVGVEIGKGNESGRTLASSCLVGLHREEEEERQPHQHRHQW